MTLFERGLLPNVNQQNRPFARLRCNVKPIHFLRFDKCAFPQEQEQTKFEDMRRGITEDFQRLPKIAKKINHLFKDICVFDPF